MKKFGMLLTLTVTLLSALGAPVFAGPAGVDPAALAADRLLDAHWNFVDACQAGETQEAGDRVKREADRLVALVVTGLRRGDRAPAEALAARYASLGEAERPALDPVLAEILDAGRALKLQGDPAAKAWLRAEELPGYGFPEPGFEYRRGKELSVEFLQAYWQDEERVIESKKTIKATLDVKLAAALKNDPAISKYMELGAPYRLDINGSFVLVVDVSFESRESFTTKARKKYEYSRVWYELFRRKAGWFSQGAWELCGKTWLMKNAPTGHEVIVSR